VRSKRAVSAGSHPPNPQNFPPNISANRPTKGQAYWRGQQIGPTSIRRGAGAGSRLKNGVIDQEEIRERVELTQKSSEIMVVPTSFLLCSELHGSSMVQRHVW